ncbi:MAG: hypothetical protein P1R58_12020 [bacterium]|nr:hypothetical protein [bacterium]
MKKYSFIFAGALALMSESVHAANFAVITSPPTILNVLVLVASVGCVAGCFKVAELVKGGLFSKSWQLFLAGFGMLVVSQIASLCVTFEILALPSFIVPGILTLMAGLFLYALYEARRILG